MILRITYKEIDEKHLFPIIKNKFDIRQFTLILTSIYMQKSFHISTFPLFRMFAFSLCYLMVCGIPLVYSHAGMCYVSSR